MNRTIIIIFLVVIIVALFFERQITSEYTAFLERDIQIEQAQRNLKEGMNEWEVMNLLVFPPDSIYNQEDNGSMRVLRWAVKEHVGPFHKFFGIEARDEKSYMELHLDFDKEKRLSRIYYGG